MGGAAGCFAFRWGHYLGSAVTSDQAGLQAVFTIRAVLLTGLHTGAGLWAVLHHFSWSGGEGLRESAFTWGHSLYPEVGLGHWLGFAIG